MKSLAEMIPNSQDLLALETEELVGVLLEYINSAGEFIIAQQMKYL